MQSTSLLLFLLLLLPLLSLVLSEGEVLTEADIRKLPLKQLKTKLWERGLECKGCAEKADYISMLVEKIDSPVIRSKDNSNSQGGRVPSGDPKPKDDAIEEVNSTVKTVKNSLSIALFT